MAVQKIGSPAGTEFDDLASRNRMFRFLLRVLVDLTREMRLLKGKPDLTEMELRQQLREKYAGR